MIKIFAKNVDLLVTSKILLHYSGKYKITHDSIVINSNSISDELLKQLISSDLELIEISNYMDKTSLQEKNSQETKLIEEKIPNELSISTSNDQQQVFNVKRGEIYYATCSATQLGFRPVLIVQNDIGNKFSPYTIVVPITSKDKKSHLPTHLKITSSDFLDGNLPKNSVLLAENIESMYKNDLKRYIGKVNTNFMDEVNKILACSIGIEPETKIIEREVVKEVPVMQEVKPIIPKATNSESKTAYIDMNIGKINSTSKLLEISSKSISNEEKVKEILELFNFHLKKNGINYVVDTICYEPKNNQYFKLSDTIERIPKYKKFVSDNKFKD